MSNFNLNNDANNHPKRERLPERTTGQIMNDLNIERDCIFNDSRFENNMCEISSKFGAEIGVKFAYEVDVIEQECHEKYSSEINSLTADLKAANLRIDNSLTVFYKIGKEKSELETKLNAAYTLLGQYSEEKSILSNQVDEAEMEVLSLEEKIETLQFNEQKLTCDFQTIINRKDTVIEERTKTAAYYQNAFLNLNSRVNNLLCYLNNISLFDATQRKVAEILGWQESKVSKIMNKFKKS